MKIEMLIDELQEIIDEAFTLPLSGGKTVVNPERIREIIDDMRSNLPIELKQAKSIAADRTNIINKSKSEAETIVQEAEDRSKNMIQQAEEKAKSTIKQAEEKANAMVMENEIVVRAQQKANDILMIADKQASEIKGAANAYLDGIMKKADEELSKNLADLKRTRESLRNYQLQTGKRPAARQRRNTQDKSTDNT